MAKWKLLEPRVPSALARDVSHIRVFENHDPRPFRVNTAPVAVPGIVFHQRGRGPAIKSIAGPRRSASRLPLAFVYGAGTTPSTMQYFGGPHTTVQVILKPHALRSLLGLDARRLVNGVLALSEIPGAPGLSALLAASSPRAKARLLIRFLVLKAGASVTRDETVERGLALVEARITSIRLPELLAELGLSQRQYERRFNLSVGISPNAYLRVRRFNEAIRLMKTGRFKTLTDIAHALNYADQSHFIRDLKEYSRITPKHISDRVDQFHEQAGFSYEA